MIKLNMTWCMIDYGYIYSSIMEKGGRKCREKRGEVN